jgi:hypothetical protein
MLRGPKKPGGVVFISDGVNTVESYSSKCQHCGKYTENIPSQKKMMDHIDLCRVCMGFVCLECAGKPCTPLMKKIEQQEEEFYRRQQLSKMLGV